MDFGNELFSAKKKCQRFDYTDGIFLLDILCIGFWGDSRIKLGFGLNFFVKNSWRWIKQMHTSN